MSSRQKYFEIEKWHQNRFWFFELSIQPTKEEEDLEKIEWLIILLERLQRNVRYFE